MKRKTIHDLLDEARAAIDRLSPEQALQASQDGAILIDTRSDSERAAHGCIPGARHHPLSTLEWTLDPASEHADPEIDLESWLVLICAEGYSSSLAAARLKSLGFRRASDLVGGFEAWRDSGLPVEAAHHPPR
jgi:rhodanese-related sulfurtransferase